MVEAVQRELDRLRSENRDLRTAITIALAKRHQRPETPWWWPLEDAMGIPRSEPARPLPALPEPAARPSSSPPT